MDLTLEYFVSLMETTLRRTIFFNSLWSTLCHLWRLRLGGPFFLIRKRLDCTAVVLLEEFDDYFWKIFPLIDFSAAAAGGADIPDNPL